MTWARLDDNFYDHPKVVMAGTAAVGLFALALAYCARHSTDGVVTHSALARLAPDDDAAALAQRLVDAGLWHLHTAGFLVHDYLHYNPSAKDVDKQRKASAERMRTLRKRAQNVRANISRSSPNVQQPRPDPVPIPTEEESKDSPARAARRANRTRFPETFLLDELRAAMVRKVGCLDPPKAFTAFRDYHAAHGSVLADWDAAWRTWVGNHERYGCPCQPGFRGRPAELTNTEKARNIAARWRAEGRI